MIRLLAIALMLALAPAGVLSPVRAASVPAPVIVPPPPQLEHVVDGAGLLPAAVRARLARQLARFERKTRHQFVVVTVRSLGGQSIEAFGLHLGRSWGIGRRGIDDGVLLIVAPNERRVRIEVGYGLEKTLTNDVCARIIDERILPAFRSGNAVGGIEAGTAAIIARLSR